MTNPKVDWYFKKAEKWQEEIEQLRIIILESGLTEELKWGVPCYQLNKRNILLIHTFKDYCALLFHKGVLLKDPENILIQQTENVQSARQLRFTSLDQVLEMQKIIRAYVMEAIEVEKKGLKVEFKKTEEFTVPLEFQKILDEDTDFKKAFESLTPGRQKGYLLFFSQPKQAKTRETRIEKCLDDILNGIGLNDKK